MLKYRPGPESKRGLAAITSAFKRLQAEDSPDADTEADIEKIATLAQAILKREWVRVKQGV